MSQELKLFTDICKPTIEEVIDTISNLVDEDFNGNNGADYTSEIAIEEGYNSDSEYIVAKLFKDYNKEEPTEYNLIKIVEEYCNFFFRNYNYYSDYTISCFNSENNFVISVAYTTDT